jgi:histidine triad (HIT) family protein
VPGPGTRESRVMECIFCRIVDGSLPATLVLENEHVVAFRDVNPQAPVHILVVPRRHVVSVAALEPDDASLPAALLLAAGEVARREGLEGPGYRVVTNVGEDGGQSVAHLHLHVLGGRSLSWPPG